MQEYVEDVTLGRSHGSTEKEIDIVQKEECHTNAVISTSDYFPPYPKKWQFMK